jgi:putative transposase
MLRWFCVLAHLVAEAGAARRDARIRFLKAQVEILRSKLGGNQVIPNPDDRARLLAIGQELNHDVAGVIGIATLQTYCRGVTELRRGRRRQRVDRPKVIRSACEPVTRLAKESSGWGYRRIIGELRKQRLCIGGSVRPFRTREVRSVPRPLWVAAMCGRRRPSGRSPPRPTEESP